MDGIIIVDKSKNCTSHDVVRKAKELFNEKVGHTGTLDPMATGVLPLLIGKGTLCSKYLMNHDKNYEVQLTLGMKTDTADGEGKLLEEKEIPQNTFQEENIKKVLRTFLGKQEQIPPMYSAIKVKGKKLYEYARKGQMVEIQPRTIEIYQIELLQIKEQQKQIKFRVNCSKGTYIRSLCEDIAKRLGTVGYMSELRRTKVGEFSIAEAVTIEEWKEKIKNKEFVEQHFITLEKLFQKEPKIELDTRKMELLLNGVRLTQKKEDGIYRVYSNERFRGIGIIENQLLKRDIMYQK